MSLNTENAIVRLNKAEKDLNRGFDLGNKDLHEHGIKGIVETIRYVVAAVEDIEQSALTK